MDSTTDERLLIPIVPGAMGAGEKLGGVGRTMIYELVKSGELVKVNIGRRSFITAKSIEAYVDRLSQAATP